MKQANLANSPASLNSVFVAIDPITSAEDNAPARYGNKFLRSALLGSIAISPLAVRLAQQQSVVRVIAFLGIVESHGSYSFSSSDENPLDKSGRSSSTRCGRKNPKLPFTAPAISEARYNAIHFLSPARRRLPL